MPTAECKYFCRILYKVQIAKELREYIQVELQRLYGIKKYTILQVI